MSNTETKREAASMRTDPTSSFLAFGAISVSEAGGLCAEGDIQL